MPAHFKARAILNSFVSEYHHNEGFQTIRLILPCELAKHTISHHRLPVQSMLAAQIDGGMTPGQVAMTPYDTNSPIWQDGLFKGDLASAAFSPLAYYI
jgi:DNA-directed RNA polymerase II subunit RPB1